VISVAIITKNEESNIGRCLDSLNWANEIVIIDSGSTDNTLEICKKYKCKVVRSKWLGFGKTKQIAVENCKYDWVLSIDADEVVSSSLSKSIVNIDLQNGEVAYRIKRKSFYLGKVINFSGWQNDYPLRFFNKNFGNFNTNNVHEEVVTKSRIKKINNPIIHYPYKNINAHLKKIKIYSSLGAELMFNKGKRAFIFKSILAAILRFTKNFFINLGFLDGFRGLVLCLMSSYYVFLKYHKLRKLNKTQ